MAIHKDKYCRECKICGECQVHYHADRPPCGDIAEPPQGGEASEGEAVEKLRKLKIHEYGPQCAAWNDGVQRCINELSRATRHTPEAKAEAHIAFIENVIELWERKEPIENFLNAIPKLIDGWKAYRGKAPAKEGE